jgi:uncharacterized protein
MKCPSCKNQLSTRVVTGITLDVCDGGCGGIWFDHFELKKLQDQKMPDAETLLSLKIDPKVKKDNDGQRKCPKCENFIMMKHFASVKLAVKIDECPKCAGFWLDAGELRQIRSEFNSVEEQTQAAEKIYDKMFGPEMAKIRQKDEEKYGKMLQISKALRFVSPDSFQNKK